MVPGDVAGHRVGWFPESALVFAEGHPAPGDFGCADDLPDVLERLELDMGSMGVLVSPSSRAGSGASMPRSTLRPTPARRV
jgi:hypothetical protein